MGAIAVSPTTSDVATTIRPGRSHRGCSMAGCGSPLRGMSRVASATDPTTTSNRSHTDAATTGWRTTAATAKATLAPATLSPGPDRAATNA